MLNDSELIVLNQYYNAQAKKLISTKITLFICIVDQKKTAQLIHSDQE